MGRYQFRWDERASWNPGLPRTARTLAERLSRAGYATARFGKSDYGDGYHRFTAREYPLNHGYDRFLGFSAHAHDYWLLSEEMAERTPDPDGTSANLGPLMQDEGSWKSYEDGYTTRIFTDAAIDYVEGRAGKERPFFLTLSYNAVHHLIHEVPPAYLDEYDVDPIPPYDPSRGETSEGEEPGSYSAYYEKYSRLGAITSEEMRRYYLANLSYLDDSIGRFLDALGREGLAENTLLVFLSDNGGSPLTSASNAPLTAGKYSLYEGGIRVLFAMRWPAGGLAAGTVHGRPISALDIVPTALAAAGIASSEKALDGVNLLPRLRGNAPAANAEPRTLLWRWQSTFAVRRGNWKLTNVGEPEYKGYPSDYYIEPKYDTQEVRLFNLEGDPAEADDVADEHPQVVRRLMNRYEKWMRSEAGSY
jgi:arylsulfatase A-like enzyme